MEDGQIYAATTDYLEHGTYPAVFTKSQITVLRRAAKLQARVCDKNFHSVPNWLKSYMPTAPQSTMMGQSYSCLIEELNCVAPKWSNRSSKVARSFSILIGPLVCHSGLSNILLQADKRQAVLQGPDSR